MPAPDGFEFAERKSGEVAIFHHGRLATTLRKEAVARFLKDVKADDPQELMARAIGNYKRGNERRNGRGSAGRRQPVTRDTMEP
jgi:hypothetical protein